MQTKITRLSSGGFIWAPLALTGSGLIPEKNVLIEISDGLIISIKIIKKECLPAPVINHPDYYCLEAGTTLLPCLADAHVHLALDGEDFAGSRLAWDDRLLLETRLAGDFFNYIQAGIGYLRDGGDCRQISLQFESDRYFNGCWRPEVISTGQAIRQMDNYGSFLGKGYCDPDEIPVIIDRLRKAGADQVKVIISGVVSFSDYGQVGGTMPPLDDLKAATDYAHRFGLKVMAHASSDAAVTLAVQAGADSIEHGYFVRAETLQMMAAKQIAWVPTVIPVAAQTRNAHREKRTEQEISVITRIYEEQVAKLSYAHSIGVPLGVGTDAGAAGVRHGLNLIEEMLLYSEGGLDNRAVIKAATSVNAKILGIENNTGVLATGFRANLIAVKKNPLEDLLSLKNLTAHFTAT